MGLFRAGGGVTRSLSLIVFLWLAASAGGAQAEGNPSPPGHEQVARAFDLIVEKHLDTVDPSVLAARAYERMVAEAGRLGISGFEKKTVASKEDLLAAFDQIRPNSEAAQRGVVGGALAGMVLSLNQQDWWDDRHVDTEKVTKRPAGSIGISMAIKDGKPTIMALPLGLPASQAGVHVGDHIVAIDGASTAGKTLNDVMALLVGEPGKPVSLKIERDRHIVDTLGIVRIDRRQISPVRARLIGHSLYIRIDSFGSIDTSQRLKASMKPLLKAGASSIILDIRANSGGLLDQAVDVSDLFLDAGLIGGVKGGVKSDNRMFSARPGDIGKGLPLIMLVDDQTANGAELLATALVENGRARTVGIPTNGKGVVKTLFELGDDFVLCFATEALLTAKGTPIEGHGLTPSFVVAETVDGSTFVPGEPGHDPQLDHALRLIELAGRSAS